MARTGLFDLEKQFANFSAYHSNPINISLHILSVWPNVFSTLLLLHFTPSFFNLTQIDFSPYGNFVLNAGFFLTLVYSCFYIALDKRAGSLAAFMYCLCWIGASLVAGRLGFSLAWKVVLATQLPCYLGQFIGHNVFEGRRPPPLENFIQTFVTAPFFVILEAFQCFCGYEPYPGFSVRVQERKLAEIKQFQSKTQKKIS